MRDMEFRTVPGLLDNVDVSLSDVLKFASADEWLSPEFQWFHENRHSAVLENEAYHEARTAGLNVKLILIGLVPSTGN